MEATGITSLTFVSATTDMTFTARERALQAGEDPVEEICQEMAVERDRHMQFMVCREHELTQALTNRRIKMRAKLQEKK